MLYRHSALAIAAAIMGSGFAGAVSLPRAAEAQVYDDAAPRPYAFQPQDDGAFDPGRGWADHRRAFDDGPRGPERFPHHGPAAYDGRGGEVAPYDGHSRGDRPPRGYGDRRWDRGDDHLGYGAGFDHPYGPGFPDRPYGVGPYEEIAVPLAPPVAVDRRGPDVGCTIQRSETTTAVGWRKIVTHQTCYRR